MYNVSDFMALLEKIAPLSLSYKLIERGSYDNSGLLVKMSDKADKILFTLDLSTNAVMCAENNGCNTIVTHHPAIYSPIKSINIDTDKALALALQKGLNIISMHLNLDVASCGIDDYLCQGLGGKNIKIIDVVERNCGYGRRAKTQKQSLDEFVQKIKDNFGTQKIIYYGNRQVEEFASFCGSGGSHAVEYLDAINSVDTIVTSDLAHHQIKQFIECEKNVVIIPHYASEQFGFNKFYELITKKLENKAQTFYYLDNRFM